ncbi:DUF5334 family protein [Bathymodiolus thermophilus thioautotrophic gill symbiont]|uniref:Secreted protein n=1 Tax=Bathymodiolus thermophilus thioautotrophic gill symbiont TaxID=2360 RepID=A0A1J5UA16_9GAMM|nr:DUF5334 family protein [Bathymodiolus thermophilus thioautotrophic gill symbiont]OIR25694.1 hypothetical protein BGC33_07560 [Bathymodiolus thermophilus thioautotrophic gill symbiont]
MKIILSVLLLIISYSVSAWDGYDHNTGNYVEIDKGNLVRQGNEIKYYDYETGEYKYGCVESVNSYGSSVEVEIYDYNTGECCTFEMDR